MKWRDQVGDCCDDLSLVLLHINQLLLPLLPLLLLLLLFHGPLSGTTQVRQYQKKHSTTHTYRDHQSSFISVLHLLWSIASSPFNLHAWQSFSTTSLQVVFGLPIGLAPSTSYSIHFFTQSLSSLHDTCPYRLINYSTTNWLTSPWQLINYSISIAD